MTYKINNIFDSIQGEGLMVGKPMNFIRFCTCNLNCSWCDTDFQQGEDMGIEDIVSRLNPKWKWVALTGGEPLMEKKLIKLIDAIHEEQFKVFTETNGTLFKKRILDESDFISADLKAPSSKSPKIDPELLDYCFRSPMRTQIKVVIQTEEDIEFFKGEYSEKYPNWIIQPEYSVVTKLNYRKLLDTISDDVRVIPQIHRFMEVE